MFYYNEVKQYFKWNSVGTHVDLEKSKYYHIIYCIVYMYVLLNAYLIMIVIYCIGKEQLKSAFDRILKGGVRDNNSNNSNRQETEHVEEDEGWWSE